MNIIQFHADKYFRKLNDNQDNKVNLNDLLGYTKDKRGKVKKNITVYTATMPYSLELKFIQKYYKNKFYFANGKLKTDAIIDVIFDKKYMIKNEENDIYFFDKKTNEYSNEKSKLITHTNRAKMRKNFYVNGFDLYINDKLKHYVFYQRGSNKVKSQHCLFIDETMIDKINEWGYMGLKFKKHEECDITSLFAYRALTSSGIIGTLNIKPNEILIIDDVVSEFKKMASVTRYNKDIKQLYVKNEELEQKSDIFDGQSLLDKSKFTDIYKDKGMILLRNKFFKSCAFSCNMQQYFKDHDDIKYLFDMFGVKHKASNIKLITTPNSLKAFKFAYKLADNKSELTEEQLNQKMFNYWLDDIEPNFGVVKYEKPTKIKSDDDLTYNQMSYQMINSLPLSTDDIKELCKYNIKEIKNIQNNFNFFKKYLGDPSKVRNSLSLAALCNINPDIQYTQFYKDVRKNIIEALEKRMREGHLIVPGDNCTMVSNPIEMLKCACGIKWVDSLHKPYEIYTKLFDDGVEVSGFRSPHIAFGNVCVFKNKRIGEIDQYMNLTKNIVVMSSYKNDVMSRLQGADQDGDAILLVNHPIVLKAAKECMSEFLTPINAVESEKGKNKNNKYNFRKLAAIDHSISDNEIGKICNLAQIYNSYYWDLKSKGAEQSKLKKIYDCVSMLSSLSQIEIDRAKKCFSLKVGEQYKLILEACYKEQRIIEIVKNSVAKKCVNKKQQDKITKLKQSLNNGDISEDEYNQLYDSIVSIIVLKDKKPLFCKCINENGEFAHFNTPMDYVIDVVRSIGRAKQNRKIKMKSLCDLMCDKPVEQPNRDTANKIEKIVLDVREVQKTKFTEQDDISNKHIDDYEVWLDYKRNTYNNDVDKIKKHTVSKATMYLLINRAFNENNKHIYKSQLNGCKKIMLDILQESHPEEFYYCFKKV